MKGFLTGLRWFFSLPLALFLFTLIIIGIIGISLVVTVSNRANISGWIAETGIYNNAVNEVLATLDRQAKSEPDSYFAELNTLLQEGSDYRELAFNLLDAQFLEQSSGEIIDGVYDWLEGKTQRPEFSIQLFSDQKEASNFFSLLFKEKLRNLPECSSDFVPEADFSPFSLSCLPEGFDTDSIDEILNDPENQQALEQLINSASFDSSELVLEQELLSRVQRVYTFVQIAPLILIAITIAFIGILILILPSQKDFWIIATLIGVAALVTILAHAVIFSNLDFLIEIGLNMVPTVARVTAEIYVHKFATAAFSSYFGKVVLVSIGYVAVAALFGFIGYKQRTQKPPQRETFAQKSKLAQ